MRNLYRLFRRGNRYYSEHVETRVQKSLQTNNKVEALRLIAAMNETSRNAGLNLALARTYLQGHDPKLTERTWGDVMERLISSGGGKSNPGRTGTTGPVTSTIQRCERAFKQSGLKELKERKLTETTAEELLMILNQGVVSTNHYLSRLHNFAVKLGWLPWRIVAPNDWPKTRAKVRRGITAEEQEEILKAETNSERRLFYELLWETGASQSDAAGLTAESIDWQTRSLSYRRMKTGEEALLIIGQRLEALLKRLPSTGPLFPTISKSTCGARAAEFRRRCRLLKLESISLHSYRYAWAERASSIGYPERWAQHALGHNSSAVHQHYAKGGVCKIISLDVYEASVKSLKSGADTLNVTPFNSQLPFS